MIENIEAVKENVDEIVVPRYFYEKFDDKQLSGLLEELGLGVSGSKDTKLYKLFSYIQKQDNLSDEELETIMTFVKKTIKYTNNRIMIEVPIKIKKDSLISNESNLSLKFDDENNFEVNQLLDLVINPNSNNINEEFTMIYRHANYNDDDKYIEMSYVREVEYAYKKNNHIENKQKYEYVWCEINILKETLCIYISNNRKSTNDKQLDGTIHLMKNHFSEKLSRELDFKIGSIYDGDTLFKMYRELTCKTEEKYSSEVKPYLKNINEFVVSMKNKLIINKIDDIGLENRITKLFERNLIQKDFEKIRKDPLADGRVLSLDFQDGTGSSVKATTGGLKNTEEGLVLLDMQDSDVYFDTKETIHSLKRLGIIVIEWNVVRDLPDVEDRYQKPKVTYLAYKDFYVCSIQRINLNEEVSNYVLSKFDGYRNLSL